MVFSLVHLFGQGMGLDLNIFIGILYSGIIALVVKFFLFNSLILYILLSIGFLGILLIHRFLWPIAPLILNRLYFLFDNIYNNLLGRENIHTNNLLAFWSFLTILVAIFTAYILFKRKSIYILLPVYIIPFLIYWYKLYDQAYWMISIFLLSFFILQSLDTNLKQNIESPWLKSGIIYAILIITISLLLPKSNNVLQWPWLQNKITRALPIVYELRAYNEHSRQSDGASPFDMASTGFQESPSQLGGPVNLSDKKIMTVFGTNREYLRGSVKHFYGGNSWETADISKELHYLRQDFSQLSKEERELFYERRTIRIKNHSFASNTLFTPLRPIKVDFDAGSTLEVSSDEILSISHGVYDKEYYDISIERPLPYGILLSLGIGRKREDIENIDYYLQIPENKITQATRELVKDIVGNIDDDFQKAKTLETYLRENYHYNINVEKLPEGKDFINHFLFDTKEGYCTYFASSLAIMLRLEGIPTRYVEGYLGHELSDEGVLEIRQRNAHAWVEAFIEPVGWMIFEATPAFPIENRRENYTSSLQENHLKPEETPRNDPIIEGETHDSNIEDDSHIILDMDIGVLQDSRDNILKYLAYILLLILIIFPIRFVYGVLYYRYRQFKISKSRTREKNILLYKQILKLIENLGHPQIAGETHYEYAKRINYRFYIHGEKNIEDITDIFIKGKYGNLPISNEDIEGMGEFKSKLHEQLKNYWGKRTYYIRKYFKTKEYFFLDIN